MIVMDSRWVAAWLILSLLNACAVFDPHQTLEDRVHLHDRSSQREGPVAAPLARFDSPVLTLLSLNLAHGRQQSVSQLLLSREQIKANLEDIAVYLRTVNADVVALQEADGPSFWSGDFNHVQFLQEQAGYRAFRRSTHVDNWLGDYGTAILSQVQPIESFGVTFLPSPPTPRKGFTLASFLWQPEPSTELIELDLISVHLDFSRESIRKQQIDEIRTVLQSRRKPTIIMGDFNSEWLAKEYVVKRLSEFGWHSFEPDARQHVTFQNDRLDWVLLSKEFEFVQYYADDVSLSDHRPVVTRIKVSE